MTDFDPKQVAETYRETHRRRGWLMRMVPLWIVVGGFVLWSELAVPFWVAMLMMALFIVAAIAGISALVREPPGSSVNGRSL